MHRNLKFCGGTCAAAEAVGGDFWDRYLYLSWCFPMQIEAIGWKASPRGCSVIQLPRGSQSGIILLSGKYGWKCDHYDPCISGWKQSGKISVFVESLDSHIGRCGCSQRKNMKHAIRILQWYFCSLNLKANFSRINCPDTKTEPGSVFLFNRKVRNRLNE